MCSALGYEVRRLQRIRIMNIHLGQQKVGTWRDLTEQEKRELGLALNYQLS
jgi:23S rRNA pseudouridine2604 synthase